MMKFTKRVAAAGVVISDLFLGASTVFAQGGTGPITLFDPLGCPSGSTGGQCFVTVLNNVMSFLFYDVAIPLATIMVLVGAFQMMTASGDPEKFSKGKKTLLYAAIGFVIALLAGGITNIIRSII